MTDDNLPQDVVNDSRAANLSLTYLLLALGFLSWLLFDVWIDAHTLPRIVGYDLTTLKTPLFHLITYTVIGGSIGGIVNGLRSALLYCGAFNGRYVWKYIAAPWQGAALAMIGFALLRSTVAIFGGDAQVPAANTPQFLANFGIGALAGYGAKDVFIWLDNQVSKLFAVKKETPDTTGLPTSAAVDQIQAEKLTVGAMAAAPVDSPEEAGKVISQVPAPGTLTESGKPVNLVVGASSNGEESETKKKPTRR